MHLDDKLKDTILHAAIDVGKQLCTNIQTNTRFQYTSIVMYKGVNDYHLNGIRLEFCRQVATYLRLQSAVQVKEVKARIVSHLLSPVWVHKHPTTDGLQYEYTVNVEAMGVDELKELISERQPTHV